LAQGRRPLLRPASRDYFAGKFVLIPRDERSLSLQQPRMLARVADHDLIVPPARAIAGAEELIEWARSVDYSKADGVIVSLDAIAGVAASRLELVSWIRGRWPRLPIYAFVTDSSDQLIQSALNLVAQGEMDFLLISRRASGARLSSEIAARGLGDKVTIDLDADAATMILLARMLNRRFGFIPKIFTLYSSIEAPGAPLRRAVGATIKAIDGAESSASNSPQLSGAERAVDALLFIHAPRTSEANRNALIEAIARDIERGAKIGLADLSETKESKEALIAELRRRKLLDKLATYSSSEPGGESRPDSTTTIDRAITHISAFLTAIRFMRDEIDRARRFDRSHFNLLFNRYLSDWAYALTIRPKLDEFVRGELKADPNGLGAATERAEAFALEQVKRVAEELFNEQFKRNIHSILLSSGQRAQFEMLMLQQLRVQFPTQKTSEIEIRQTVYIPQINFPDMTPRWFLATEGVDERIERRLAMTNWRRFKTDTEVVEVSVRLAPGQGSQESYAISSSRRRDTRRIMITAPSSQGVFYALSKLESLGAEGHLAADFQVNESPSFERRGVAENFRGAPWSHKDRLEMMRFLGLARVNRYFYAPQGDSLRLDRWREDYSDQALEEFKQLAQTAEENFAQFIYSINPGGPKHSITYSSGEDTATLIRKLDSMRAIGARGFALCFDDAPPELQKDEDRARFKTLASAQAHLINQVHKRLKQSGADFELYVAPTLFADARLNQNYLKELGAAVPQDILFFRSGADSPERAASQTESWSALANRRPVVQDNFPINEEPWRLSLSPKHSASPTLSEGASGLVVNGMSQARASMLPIMTAADYMWDSRGYDPARSFNRALDLLYDERAREGMRVWAQIQGERAERVFKPLFQKQTGAVNVEWVRRELAELQTGVEMIGVTLNQALLRGELAQFIRRLRSAVEMSKNDPNYEKPPAGDYRLMRK
jgi:hypothetical protein